MTRLLWIEDLQDPGLATSVEELRRELAGPAEALSGSPALRLQATGDARAVLSTEADAVVVWADHPLESAVAERLASAGLPVLLAGPSLQAADPTGLLAEAAGLHVTGATPVHDVRVHGGPGHPLAARHVHAAGDHVEPHLHVRDRVLLVDKVRDDVEVLQQAWVGLAAQPVATWRAATRTAAWTLGARHAAVSSRETALTVLELLRRITGTASPSAVRVGLLGYGAIGHEHSRAVRAVDGLELAAVCDTSPERLAAAVAAAPGVASSTRAEELLARDDVDLVIVSTPPSSHAEWALRALEAGKHVILEKPFALETTQADLVMAEAASAGLLVAVYQNRRFDPDHLAVRRAVRAGLLGELFHVETFVGGYGHPCNLWHSDAGVSGGAFYDWGSHVLDQVLDLVPGPVEHVTAAAHKLRWFDVTNADHSRVTVRFADGAEAEFVHSDLAAALKPRWYVLGTEGALVGQWRTERIVGRNDIGTLVEDVLAPADSPPLLDLHAADGSVTRLATPASGAYPFHHELSDRLRLGLPMSVTAAQSRRVLSVMEAARISADTGGRPVEPR
ncbi:MAG: gfo/Idh/MocA family oxidoreductase [Frankiales bacterium]|nr:gfo/Idh/MocA family oxidoreductase [Frankiales bacterium]